MCYLLGEATLGLTQQGPLHELRINPACPSPHPGLPSPPSCLTAGWVSAVAGAWSWSGPCPGFIPRRSLFPLAALVSPLEPSPRAYLQSAVGLGQGWSGMGWGSLEGQRKQEAVSALGPVSQQSGQPPSESRATGDGPGVGVRLETACTNGI